MAATVSPTVPADDGGPQVDVGIDDLLIGKPLQFPVHDQNGILLLAAGATITTEFKRILKERRMTSIRVSQSDAAALTLDASLAADLPETSVFNFDTELTKKLDTVIDAGLLGVKNTGPAVRDSVVFHGKKAFNLEQREQLLKSQSATTSSVDSMIKTAIRGGSVDGGQITQMAMSCMTDLTHDTDHFLSIAMEASRHGLSDHCFKMAMLGMAIGVEMGFDAENIRTIAVAGLVSDWGMTRVPEAIRTAARALTSSEMLQIQKHPIYTLDILEKMSGVPRLVPMIAYQVHERPNGTGYPRARQGISRIHQFARILNVADTYSALTSPRPFRPPLMPYAAMECLLHQARLKAVDPDVVRALLHSLSLFPIGSFVALSDGSVGRTIRRNGKQYSRPIVQVLRDAAGKSLDPNDPSSLVDTLKDGVEVAQALPTPGSHEIGLSPEILNNFHPY